jgi:hypothetical protein
MCYYSKLFSGSSGIIHSCNYNESNEHPSTCYCSYLLPFVERSEQLSRYIVKSLLLWLILTAVHFFVSFLFSTVIQK